MDKVVLIILIILWLVYCMYEGHREAYYWYYYVNTKSRLLINAHPYFAQQRIIVALIICIVLRNELYDFFFTLTALGLTFSFIHNGNYYKERNELDKNVYPKRFWDQSKTSTATLTRVMTPISRTVQFIIGMVIFIYLILK